MTDDTIDDAGDHDLATRSAELAVELAEADAPTETVVRAVASLTNTRMLDLDPLYDAIDPEYLDGLFGEPALAPDSSLRFTHAGCDVTVTQRTVRVRGADAREPGS